MPVRATALRFCVAAWLPVLAVGIAGCNGDETGASGDARVQLLQADPSAPVTVAFTIDNATVASSVEFGQSSPRITLAAGAHRLAIESLAGPIAELEGSLGAGKTYYAVSAGGGLFLTEAGSIESGGQIIPPDTGQRNPLRAHIRFVNVVSEPNPEPALVHAYVTAPATVDTTFRFGLDTRIASYGTLIYLDPGSVTVRIQPQGQSTVLAEDTFSLALGEVKAIVLERDQGGALRLRIVVEQ